MALRHVLRFWMTLALLCGALTLPGQFPEQALAQPPRVLIDGGPREGTPVPTMPVLSYGIVLVLLAIGGGIGLAAVVIIRQWDRQRPTERQAEAAAHEHPTNHIHIP
jgi:hypothetical protein